MKKQLDFNQIEKAARTRKKIQNVIVYTLLTFWAVMVLFPFYWMLLTSVKMCIIRALSQHSANQKKKVGITERKIFDQ